MSNKVLIDGYSSFAGGMDSSRGPSVISSNQYVYAVNCILPKSSDGIATRKGFRCLKIQFQTSKEEEIFSTGNIQAGGNYTNFNSEIVLLYVINGYFFEITGKGLNRKARVLNYNDQHDPNQKHNYITRIPFGAIINDGYSAPFYTSGLENRRTRPSSREIPAGLMGIYVQNRFWFVRPDRKNIWSSTIKQPLSFDEALIDNIYGITCPEDDQDIVAIGKQGTARSSAVSGNLCFATKRDFYSADVRGGRNNWGIVGGQGSGFVNNTIPGMGAVSHNSFESFNANIFYRHPEFGLISLNQSLSDYSSLDNAKPQTIEASLFFDRDTKHFLDSCITRKYRKSVLTTIAPQHRNGFVYWNGILVKTPDPYYGKQSGDNKFIDIVESVFTGLRPWDIQTIGDVNPEMIVLSYDHDGSNRLYVYDENLDYDILYDGTKSEIESKLLTKIFDFRQPFIPKNLGSQFYSLSHLNKKTKIEVFSRISQSEPFKIFSELTFSPFSPCKKSGALSCNNITEDRDNVSIPSETRDFYGIQHLIKLKGSATMNKLIMVASEKSFKSTSYKETTKKQQEKNCFSESVFTYKI